MAAAIWSLISLVALGAVLLAAFDWQPGMWIVLVGMTGLVVINLLIWLGVIAFASYDGDEAVERRD